MTKHLLIMAGGTGGHIFPGLAVAKAMQQADWQISWLGALNGLEAKLVPAANLALYTLPVTGLRGKGWAGLVAAPYRVIVAVYKAWRLLRKLQPDLVIGFGGYASGPGGIAAWLLGIPLMVHEQNAVAGMTNRLLARFAKIILQAFPNTFPAQLRAKTIGNPIRQELITLPAPQQRMAKRNGPIRILIIGGSRGALALNKTIVEGLARLPTEQRPEIWHQTGEQHLAVTQQWYAEKAVVARTEAFIDNMALAYTWADLVICRAGALTVSELAAVGLGSILVPFPQAVDDHQTANAKFLEQAGAAILITQHDFTPERFIDLCQSFMIQPQRCLDLAQAAYQQRQIEAVEIIKQLCEDTIKMR